MAEQQRIEIKGSKGCSGNPDCDNSPLPDQWQPGADDKPSDGKCIQHNTKTGPVIKPQGNN